MLSCKEVIEEHGASSDDFGVDIVYMQLLREGPYQDLVQADAACTDEDEDPVLEVPVPDTALRKNPEDAEHVVNAVF